ncbi:MAG: TlpA disulfide reductase family protein [Cytophagales bacterium]|nr:TlpA family protein disulfide reductase [Bernardetiaceae bacterium]MDW8204557.1 TlpA disulfide reductase family protein [Cytophagales bacterium]
MNAIRLISLLTTLLLLNGCQNNQGGISRGVTAPDFETTDLQGVAYKLSNYKGKVVMLYFWADWCPACRKEFPETQAYYQKLKSDQFELLAINVAQPRQASEEFYRKYKATFPMLLDTTGSISKQYGVEELPTNYFIDPEGKVARRIVGWIGEPQVRVMINQLAKNK